MFLLDEETAAIGDHKTRYTQRSARVSFCLSLSLCIVFTRISSKNNGAYCVLSFPSSLAEHWRAFEKTTNLHVSILSYRFFSSIYILQFALKSPLAIHQNVKNTNLNSAKLHSVTMANPLGIHTYVRVCLCKFAYKIYRYNISWSASTSSANVYRCIGSGGWKNGVTFYLGYFSLHFFHDSQTEMYNANERLVYSVGVDN